MNPLRRFASAWLILFAFVLPVPSAAQTAQAPAWACWYQPTDHTLRCLLIRIPASLDPARVERLRQAVDRRLPELVRVIRASPERLATQLVNIPLWTAPYEMDFARELAEAVMCGARADCSVLFDANADGGAPRRAASLRADADEASDADDVERLAEIVRPKPSGRGGEGR